MAKPQHSSPRLARLVGQAPRIGAALTGLLFVAFLGWSIFASDQVPATGVRFTYDDARQAWVATAVNPFGEASAAGVRVGDILTSIDDATPRATVTLDSDKARRLVLTRPETGQTIAVKRFQTADGANPTPFYVMGTLFCLVGLGALAFGRGSATRALALFCSIGAFMIANLPNGFRGIPESLIVNALALPPFIGSFALLFAVFPVQRSLRIGPRRIQARWILAPSALVSLSYLIVYLAPSDRTFLIKNLLIFSYYIPCLVLGIGLLVRSWWQSKNTRANKQLRVIAIGSTVAMLPVLIFTLIPILVMQHPLLPPEFAALPLGFIPLAFGYAILRYQVMDLQLYVRRGVLYSAFAGIVAGIYGIVVVVATMVARAWTDLNNVVAVGVIAIILAVVGDRLRSRLTEIVDRLFDRRHYDYRQQLLEFSQRMSTIEDADELAQATIDQICQTMGTTRVRFYLYDVAREVYHLWVWAGPAPIEDERLLGTRHPMVLDAQRARSGFVQQFEAPPDTDALLLPLLHRGQPIALLTLGRKESELPYSSEDLALLRTVANQLAIATENTQLYGRMRDLYLSGVRTLAATVDAKDSYTHGHSERVASYSRAIAVALGLPQLEVETIELAGLLHDLGKIGVPDAVLQKPGRLDPGERSLIEQHADLGARILADNPALLPLVPLVRHHHERFDGKGYPSGLAGEAIPLGAAIIAIADTYDTMTTDRPYRRAPGHERARDEVVRCGGSQFHPRVVEAFLKGIESPGWRATVAQSSAQWSRSAHLAARLAGANTRAMNIVYQIAQTIGDVTDLTSFTMRVVELLRRELGTRAVDIFLLDEINDEFYQVTPTPGMEPRRFPAGRGLIGWVAQHQRSARVEDTREDMRVLYSDGWTSASEIAVPLISQERAFGVINVESQRTGAFTEEDETVLVMVARQLSQVLEVAHLHDQLKRTATQDGLTGIANYRSFYGRLETELIRAEALGTPLALMLIDVNGLKQLNDTYGHLAGDGAIRRIAQLLQEASREDELVARYGGDEFAVILPEMNEVAATRRAKELTQAVRDIAVFEFDGQQLPLPTISYGIATYGIDGDRTLSLVAAADARMYTQKVNHYSAERRARLSLVEDYFGRPDEVRGRAESE